MPYLDSFVKKTARLSPGPIRKSTIAFSSCAVMVSYTSPERYSAGMAISLTSVLPNKTFIIFHPNWKLDSDT
ncbi:hypothetical protein GQ43DRAFT_491472 [Delitschia confertaspora ATCC 74209]|uniref:Uncharacterized protein n=1 Tax=Delitschia confertaspora ATCC 74209 TaxID=1513339 RepID=A0A9P4JHZ7_9PLEO|nr:hypothetical protein GQ43DRAFT_491472 [Delitschia confertaspora ATCC 74209]